jgi:hypothetical protein
MLSIEWMGMPCLIPHSLFLFCMGGLQLLHSSLATGQDPHTLGFCSRYRCP